MTYFKDLFGRLCQSWRWATAQFVVTALLILAGLAWTRLPEKHVWQVLLSLLLPLLLAISVLELQAGTMRSFAGDDGKRVKLVWGAITLLVWIAVAWVAWALLDWCDAQFYQWASYLNSQAPAHLRAKLLTYEHIYLLLYYLEWVFRWIVVPAKVIPFAMASAQWGLRLPWRNVIRLLWNWRWWLGVTIAALLAVELPARLFAPDPYGTVSAQIWRVSLKLAATYLLAVGSWILLLGWAGVLFGRQKPLPEDDALTELFERLRASRRWVGAIFGWGVLSVLDDLFVDRLPTGQDWIKAIAALVLILFALILVAGMLRSLLGGGEKRVRPIWGTLSMLIWAAAFLGTAFLLSLWNVPIAPWLLGWVVAPAVLLPFGAASAAWGLRLPWRRILQLLLDWRWWLGVLAAAVVGGALPSLIDAATQSTLANASLWRVSVKESVDGLLAAGSLVLLLGWLALLFDRQQPQPDGALALILGQAEPHTGEDDAEKPPLSEGE